MSIGRKHPQARRAAAAAPAAATRAGGAAELAAAWAPTAGRVLLGLVLAWFGYHELVQPGLWTGYVPLVYAAGRVRFMAPGDP